MNIPVALFVLISTGFAGQIVAQTKPPLDFTRDCSAADCHGSLKKHDVVHSPVDTDSCDACHEASPGDEHGFALVEQGSDLCLECHEEHEGKVVHHPVGTGPCMTCHDPHASDTPNLLTASTVGELCNECHDELFEDLDFLHGPVAAKTCTACHEAHSSDIAGLLKAPAGELCVGCHDHMNLKEDVAGHIHAPVKDGCTACHNPHGGANRMILAADLPDLCVDCHDDIGDLNEDSLVKHDALTTGKSCLNCHAPHSSKHASLLLGPTMPLCLSCHDRKVKSGEDELADIAATLSGANPHGPLRDEDCVTCHSPHGSDNVRLLTAAYPSSFYSPYSEEHYALCFDCHDADAFEDEETESLTKFRNGKRNLHYLHVNRSKKGRTCRACHDPHASKNNKHIAESVPFGAWLIPLNFVATSTGGSCAPGCHRPYHYDRTKQIQNVRASKRDNDL